MESIDDRNLPDYMIFLVAGVTFLLVGIFDLQPILIFLGVISLTVGYKIHSKKDEKTKK